MKQTSVFESGLEISVNRTQLFCYMLYEISRYKSDSSKGERNSFFSFSLAKRMFADNHLRNHVIINKRYITLAGTSYSFAHLYANFSFECFTLFLEHPLEYNFSLTTQRCLLEFLIRKVERRRSQNIESHHPQRLLHI